MEYRRLGNSGLKVTEIGLGGNNFGWYADEQTSIHVIHHALDLGVNYIDTNVAAAGWKLMAEDLNAIEAICAET